MSEPSQVPATASSPLHQPARDNSGNPTPPLQAHTQRPDPAPGPEAHRLAQMTAGELAQLELADQIRDAHSTVHRRQPDGSVTIEPRQAGNHQPDGAGTNPVSPTDEAPAATEKVRVGEYEISAEELGAMMQRQAAEDLRKGTLPQSPDAYKVELPADFRPPGGVEFKFDANDPAIVAAKNWAHSRGLSQEDFGGLLSIYAGHQAQQQAVINAARDAEIAKIGVSGPQRIDAISRWLRAEVGDADARPILATLATAAHVRLYERLMTKISNQGTAPFSQQHRERPAERGVSDAQYETMSPAQRLDYARQSDQRQFNNPPR